MPTTQLEVVVAGRFVLFCFDAICARNQAKWQTFNKIVSNMASLNWFCSNISVRYFNCYFISLQCQLHIIGWIHLVENYPLCVHPTERNHFAYVFERKHAQCRELEQSFVHIIGGVVTGGFKNKFIALTMYSKSIAGYGEDNLHIIVKSHHPANGHLNASYHFIEFPSMFMVNIFPAPA